jgi:hypothetical protein
VVALALGSQALDLVERGAPLAAGPAELGLGEREHPRATRLQRDQAVRASEADSGPVEAPLLDVDAREPEQGAQDLGGAAPVDLLGDEQGPGVLGLGGPESAGADHLKALARISRLLRNQAICEKLRGAESSVAILALLCEPESSQAA